MNQRVDVIVLNYNGADHLPACLVSLQRQSHRSVDIMVADNGSRDGSRGIAQGLGIRFLDMGSNYGFSHTNNAAAAHCKGDLIFFVNNDMKFDPRCVELLATAFSSDPNLFASDPMQLDWEGSCVVHGRTRISPNGLGSWFPLVRVDYTAPAQGNCFVPWGCAGSLMVDRKKFLALGGFDETFFLDCEDLDLCWRAWMRGWPTVHIPEARLYHKVGATVGSMKGGEAPSRIPEWRGVGFEQNFLRFLSKTMSPPHLGLFVGCKLLQTCALAFRGEPKRASILAKALVKAAELWPSTWSERRGVHQTSIRTGEDVLRAFLRDGDLH